MYRAWRQRRYVLIYPKYQLSAFIIEIFIVLTLFDSHPIFLLIDLEWRLVHTVMLSDGSTQDTELDSIMVGPVKIGKNKFVFSAPPPDLRSIPREEICDMTGLMLIGAYNDHVFIRVGYYTRVEFPYELPLDASGKPVPPQVINYGELIRNIAAAKPRVTRYIIPWDQDADELIQIEAAQPLEGQQQAYATEDDQTDALNDLFMGDYEEDDDLSEEGDVEIDIE